MTIIPEDRRFPLDGDATTNAVPRNLSEALGMSFERFEEGEQPYVVHGTMPVDGRTGQPFGYLSGGSSLAFAETLAGYGSCLHLTPQEKPVGSTVTATHTAPVAMGEGVMVYGTATLLHRGRSTHLWNIDITNADGRLISTARVLNIIVRVG